MTAPWSGFNCLVSCGGIFCPSSLFFLRTLLAPVLLLVSGLLGVFLRWSCQWPRCLHFFLHIQDRNQFCEVKWFLCCLAVYASASESKGMEVGLEARFCSCFSCSTFAAPLLLSCGIRHATFPTLLTGSLSRSGFVAFWMPLPCAVPASCKQAGGYQNLVPLFLTFQTSHDGSLYCADVCF